MFYDKLTFIYLTMPWFTKNLKALKTRFDKWLYLIKNLPKLDRLPNELRESVFEKFFEAAAIAKLSPDEHKAYRDSLKNTPNYHFQKCGMSVMLALVATPYLIKIVAYLIAIVS